MPKTKHPLSRRDLLELVAASGAMALLPNVVSAGPTPTPCDDQPDAELVGALLWAAFKKGAQITEIPQDVINKGRDLSGPPICAHLKDGLENFPYDRTMVCAKRAGVLAKQEAAGSPITADHFEHAWNTVHHEQMTAMERLSKKKGMVHRRGGAC